MTKVLKVIGRVVKMVAVAFSLGGWAVNFVSPELALAIGGIAYFIGDGIVLSGDLLDDGKLNNSFQIEGE